MRTLAPIRPIRPDNPICEARPSKEDGQRSRAPPSVRQLAYKTVLRWDSREQFRIRPQTRAVRSDLDSIFRLSGCSLPSRWRPLMLDCCDGAHAAPRPAQ
eukprot:14733036-Alexandrium_andersonii.AAC.1